MQLANIDKIFGKKQPEPEPTMRETSQFNRQSAILEASINPQVPDEQILMDKNNMLAELRRWQQDRSPQMRNLFEKLCARRFSKEGDALEIPGIRPLTSINGAYQLVNFIESLDVNVMMSNYSELRINLVLRYGIGYPLVQFIKDNYKELGIEKNLGKLRYITNLIMNTIEPTYYRALNAGERNLDGKIYKINRIEDGTKTEEKKGVFK